MGDSSVREPAVDEGKRRKGDQHARARGDCWCTGEMGTDGALSSGGLDEKSALESATESKTGDGPKLGGSEAPTSIRQNRPDR